MSFTLIEKQQFNLYYKDVNFVVIFTICIIMYFICTCSKYEMQYFSF